MRLSEIYSNSKELIISFEVFPPKGDGLEYDKKVNDLLGEISKMKKYNPSMISVTYGAGGSTREKTFELVLKIKQDLELITMPHFTCVNFDKTQILDYVKRIEAVGIKNILALRGDPPKGMTNFIPPENGFAHANELVEFIRANTDLSIGVAGYPEKHPEAVDINMDLKNLKYKVQAGADVIFTQLFFDNDDFFKFSDALYKMDVQIPIIPGIMILQSISQIDRIISLSGSKIPELFKKRLYEHSDDADYVKKIGLEYAIEQVKQLKSSNVKGLHLYSLNKADAVSQLLDNI